MDEAVLRALAKWPDVPACHGWLALDARGRWRLAGEIVRHKGLAAFLSRNYAADHGAWFCQNGPQRAYVDLPGAPWVLLTAANGELETHTGLAVTRLTAAWLDSEGRLLFDTEHGLALASDLDLPHWLDAIRDASNAPAGEEALAALLSGENPGLHVMWRAQSVPLQPAGIDDLAARDGIVLSPQAPVVG